MIRCACSLMRSQRSSARKPRRRSASISPTSTSGSITTPGPSMQMRPGWSTPAGTRFRMVFSPFTTSVWPALLPPWKRTTTSALAARRSTTFPFPSSPHCVPMMTVAGIRLETQLLCGDDLGQRAQRVEHVGRHRLVDVDQRERHAAHPLAAELDAGDVDAALAEERADAPHHARHVAVVEHQDVALGHRLHAEALDLGDAHRVGAEHRSEEHTSELQSRLHLVCRLLLEKKNKRTEPITTQSDASHQAYVAT